MKKILFFAFNLLIAMSLWAEEISLDSIQSGKDSVSIGSHTEFSTDSEAPVGSMIEAAIQKGLTEICLTDHYDQDYPEVPDVEGVPFIFDVAAYFRILE